MCDIHLYMSHNHIVDRYALMCEKHFTVVAGQGELVLSSLLTVQFSGYLPRGRAVHKGVKKGKAFWGP